MHSIAKKKAVKRGMSHSNPVITDRISVIENSLQAYSQNST
jgi:hypothetical protein